jgi:hypothetical protein
MTHSTYKGVKVVPNWSDEKYDRLFTFDDF